MQPYKSHQTHLSAAQEEAAEQELIKEVVKFVEETFASLAKLTNLPVQEVLHIVEEVDVAQLTRATQVAIKKISNATDLHRTDIIAIFKEDKTATIDHVVHRLREVSHVHRARI
jgi:ethanolamine utilization microcompartment shell protein EutL